MNGRKAKQIRKQAKHMMLEWYKTLLPNEEEKDAVTEEVVLSQIPQNKVKSLGSEAHSAYSLAWFIKAEKLKYYEEYRRGQA